MTTELNLAAAEESRAIAEHKLAALRAQTESKALERTLSLIESPQPVVVPWSEYPAFDEFARFPAFNRPYYQTHIEDRIEGRYRPLYENEHDLRRMRAEARKLHDLFPIAQGAVDTLNDYVIGSGWEFNCKPKDRNNPLAVQLAAMLQPYVDRILDRNKFIGDLDREIHQESRVDGEAFVAVYPDGRNDVRLEIVQPDFILEPAKPHPIHRMLKCSHKLNYWWHGVHTQFNPAMKRDDVTRPLGYHAVFDREGDQWDYLPARQVEHIKRNVTRQGRRGVSDYAIVLKDLEDEAKLRHNTAAGAAILAAIVMIRQHAEGVPRSSIEGMVSENATSRYEKPTDSSSRTVYSENVRPGTVKDIPYGMTATTGPLGQLRSAVYIEVAQYLLRIISVRWRLTEAMISGDASNNNRASMEVSEGGPIKAREHDQAFYASHFESLIWKALAQLVRMGALPLPWDQLVSLVNVQAEYSSPASRNKLELAQTNQILHDAGIMSKRTWAAEHNLDLDEEVANGAAEKIEPAPVIGGPGGKPFGESRAPRLEQLAEQALRSLTEGRDERTQLSSDGDSGNLPRD